MSALDAGMRRNLKTLSAKHMLRRFASKRDGAAAIEFAFLAIPYFLVVFAIIETFIAFAAEELVSSAVDTMSRKLRTGQITYNLKRPTDKSEAQFRQLFCDEISILIQCSAAEVATPSKLVLDIRSFGNFSDMPDAVPMNETGLDKTAMRFAPGGSASINMVRAYYHWQVVTDLVRPYITPYRTTTGAVPGDYLIVATAAFQNEQYP
jgi:Flp pilus assembly protein TadG